MKKIVVTALLFLSTTASAGGQFDGIYNKLLSSGYLSVAQNGQTVVIFGLLLSGYTINNTSFNIGNGMVVRPTTMNVFSYYIGQMNADGVSARLENSAASLGACRAIADFLFSGQSLTMTLVSSTNTIFGNTQPGVSCPTIMQQQIEQGTTTNTYTKIF